MPNTPTTYYTSAYSGEEIDAAVGRAAQGGVIDETLLTLSRRNLLDNWYFGNPVNQRGQTEYTLAWDQYCVDRWHCESDNLYVRIDSDGLYIKNNDSTAAQFKQTLPEGFIPAGTAVACSLLCQSLSGTCAISYEQAAAPYSSSISSHPISSAGLTAAYGVQLEKQHKFIISLGAGAEIKISAVKLELGSTQTLAHKENGSWVLNEIPDYGEQLRRCQRYAVELNTHDVEYPTIGIGQARSSNQISCIVPLAAMRAVPTITTDWTKWSCGNQQNYLQVSGGFVNADGSGSVQLFLTVSGAIPGVVYEVGLSSYGKALLTSDL